MKPMTLSTMLYNYVHKREVYESIGDYKDPVPNLENNVNEVNPLSGVDNKKFLLQT